MVVTAGMTTVAAPLPMFQMVLSTESVIDPVPLANTPVRFAEPPATMLVGLATKLLMVGAAGGGVVVPGLLLPPPPQETSMTIKAIATQHDHTLDLGFIGTPLEKR